MHRSLGIEIISMQGKKKMPQNDGFASHFLITGTD